MADEPLEPPETPETPPVETPPATPAPTFVAADEFRAFQATITGTLQTINEGLRAIQSSRVNEPQREYVPPAIEDATDEEIDAALANGSGAKAFRKAINAGVEKVRRELTAQNAQLQNVGYSSIGALAAEVAKPKMKYYDRTVNGVKIAEKVENYVKQLDPASRTNPGSYIAAYNVVVGENHDAIVAEEVEAALRQARTPSNVPVPPSGSGRTNGSPIEQSPEEVFGKEAMDALRFKGLDADSYARKLGYADAKAYAKLAREQEDEMERESMKY